MNHMIITVECEPTIPAQAWRKVERFMKKYLKNPNRYKRRLPNGLRSINIEFSQDIFDTDLIDGGGKP